jgi:hypothetical protein
MCGLQSPLLEVKHVPLPRVFFPLTTGPVTGVLTTMHWCPKVLVLTHSLVDITGSSFGSTSTVLLVQHGAAFWPTWRARQHVTPRVYHFRRNRVAGSAPEPVWMLGGHRHLEAKAESEGRGLTCSGQEENAGQDNSPS